MTKYLMPTKIVLFGLLIACSTVLSACGEGFTAQCLLVKEEDKSQSLGDFDSIEFLATPYGNGYRCTHLCFSILHRTQVPILVKVSGDISNESLFAEDPHFYSFLKNPGTYQYKFINSDKCRDRAKHDREDGVIRYASDVNECIAVIPKAIFTKTLQIKFSEEPYSVSKSGPFFSYNRNLFAEKTEFIRNDIVIAKVKNIYYTDFLGHSERKCLGTSENKTGNPYELEDLILNLLIAKGGQNAG